MGSRWATSRHGSPRTCSRLFLSPKIAFEPYADPVLQWVPLGAGVLVALAAVVSGGTLFGVVADRTIEAVQDKGDPSADGWTWPRPPGGL